LFAQAESTVAQKQWERSATDFADFRAAMERHFSMEEQVLFPTIEERTGQTAGPTQVMRMEHQQMRSVLAELQQCITEQNSEEYLGLSETLLILMRQHNAKEEQILYPMSDQVLNHEVPSIIEQMGSL
ncbi:hemerythrin HHE cation binding domain protein, partial [Candidatus Thiomargarita nelsonii]